MVKFELVCPEPEVDLLVNLIRDHGRTGEPGDGIVFVAPVERAVKGADRRRGPTHPPVNGRLIAGTESRCGSRVARDGEER